MPISLDIGTLILDIGTLTRMPSLSLHDVALDDVERP